MTKVQASLKKVNLPPYPYSEGVRKLAKSTKRFSMVCPVDDRGFSAAYSLQRQVQEPGTVFSLLL
jgi:hypothetical protein